MAGADDIISNLTDNQSFINWLRGKAQGRGVPTWTDKPNAGRYGGYSGWEPGMPRAPGNSPSDIMRRFGGTYTPNGAMPIPNAGAIPPQISPLPNAGPTPPPASFVGGSSGPPGYPLGSGIPGAGPWSKGFAPSQLGLALPMGMLASQPDRAHVTQDQMISGLAKWRAAQQGTAPPSATAIPQVQSGGTLPPVVPTAPDPSAPVASNAPRMPVAHPLAPQPTQPWPSPTVAQSAVPVPRPRPQPTVPIPIPRPQMAQVPTPRPAPAVQGNQLDQVLRSLFGRPTAYNQQAVNTSNL